MAKAMPVRGILLPVTNTCASVTRAPVAAASRTVTRARELGVLPSEEKRAVTKSVPVPPQAESKAAVSVLTIRLRVMDPRGGGACSGRQHYTDAPLRRANEGSAAAQICPTGEEAL